MTDTYKVLLQGQFGASVASLGGPASAKSWIVKNITVVNNDTSARTFALYRGGTAAANIITPPNISVPAGGMAEWDGTLAIQNAESFSGGASVATQLTYTFSGDEVS